MPLGPSLTVCPPTCRSFTAPWWTTSVLFPHRLGLPYKRSLRNLMADYPRQIIQDNGECWGTGTWGPWGLWGLQAPGP